MTDKRKLEIIHEISSSIEDYAQDMRHGNGDKTNEIKQLVRLIYCLTIEGYKETFGNEVKEQVRDFFECDKKALEEIFN